MLRLSSESTGNSLTLEVLGWQFPAAINNDHDSEWLVVRGSVKNERGDWKFTDPCLTMPEAWQLVQWLRLLGSIYARPATTMSFIEPNLSFEVGDRSETEVQLEIQFGLEACPPWADPEGDWPVLSFALPPERLLEAGWHLSRNLCQLDDRPSRPRLIGYWSGGHGNRRWPDPTTMVDSEWDRERREVIADYLTYGTLYRAYLGMSRCRFCGENLGNKEWTDGWYAWPEGFRHYVAKHAIRPPDLFVEHVERRQALIEGGSPETQWWQDQGDPSVT